MHPPRGRRSGAGNVGAKVGAKVGANGHRYKATPGDARRPSLQLAARRAT